MKNVWQSQQTSTSKLAVKVSNEISRTRCIVFTLVSHFWAKPTSNKQRHVIKQNNLLWLSSFIFSELINWYCPSEKVYVKKVYSKHYSCVFTAAFEHSHKNWKDFPFIVPFLVTMFWRSVSGAYLGSCQILMIELFCENSRRLLANEIWFIIWNKCTLQKYISIKKQKLWKFK